MHIFQHRKLVVYRCDEPFQTRRWGLEVDAAHAIPMLERKRYFLFILRGEVSICIIEIDDEREGRRMCEHFSHGCAMCTDEAKT
jgi:hypothetical protein